MEDIVIEVVAMGLEEVPEGEALQNCNRVRQETEDSDPT